MSIIALLILLALIGLAAWALTKYVPMPNGIRNTIIVVAILACVLLALMAFGVWGEVKSIRVPSVS